MPWNVVIQNVFDELGVGIDDGDAVAGGDVPGEDVPQERAFAGTRAAEEREMTASRVRHDIDRPAFTESIFTAANEDRMERHGKENKKRSLRPVCEL
jgi:hypothetical protein